jgi:hypothetical protein
LKVAYGTNGRDIDGSCCLRYYSRINKEEQENHENRSYDSIMESMKCHFSKLKENLLLLFIVTANGLSPGGSGTTIKHNSHHTK